MIDIIKKPSSNVSGHIISDYSFDGFWLTVSRWFWSSGGSILTLIKKCGPQNIARSRLHLQSSTIDRVPDHYKNMPSFSNFNLQYEILLCLAWFTTIPGTNEVQIMGVGEKNYRKFRWYQNDQEGLKRGENWFL